MFPTGLETKGWKQEWSYLSWPPTDPLGRICIPVPVTVFCEVRSPSSEKGNECFHKMTQHEVHSTLRYDCCLVSLDSSSQETSSHIKEAILAEILTLTIRWRSRWYYKWRQKRICMASGWSTSVSLGTWFLSFDSKWRTKASSSGLRYGTPQEWGLGSHAR